MFLLLVFLALAVAFLKSFASLSEHCLVRLVVQITYSSIIDGYAKAGKEEDALATFSKMREIMKRSPGIHPDRWAESDFPSAQ